MIAEITIGLDGGFRSIKWKDNGAYRNCPHCNITCRISKTASYFSCAAECLDATVGEIVYSIWRRGHLVVIQ